MMPYLLLMGASLAGGPLLRRRPQYRREFLLALGTACWLLSSLRYVTGFDYRSYEAFFQNTVTQGLAGSQAEQGFRLLGLAVAWVGGDYRAFLFVFHFLLTVLVFAWIGRYSASPWMSVYLFVALQYFALSMNLLRQALAAAVVLWSYPFLKSHRFLPYCGVVLLAACFHRTALIMLPFYVLLNLRVSKLHYGLATAAAGIVYLKIDMLLQMAADFLGRYRNYFDGMYWQANGFAYILFPLGCFLFVLPLLRREAEDFSRSPVLTNSVFYATLMQLFITRHFILERLSIYLAMLSLLALPEAAQASGRRCSARVRTGLLIVGAFLYFLFAAKEGFHGVYPYHGVWSRAMVP